MKNRLCLHLMANKEKGFALPLAVLIGLILMVTGMSMIMRAQGDQSKVIAQNAKADGFRSSEAGVTRVQDLLNSVRVMATVPSNCTSGDCWQNARYDVDTDPTDLQKHLKKLYTATACSNPDNPNAAATLTANIAQLQLLSGGQWSDLGNNRYYRVAEYRFTPIADPNILGLGVLTLEGRSRKSAETDLTKTDLNIDSDDNAASRNRVVVTVPILPSPPPAFNRTTVPALWISEGNADGDAAQFQGDVVEEVVSPGCNNDQNKIQQPTPEPSPGYKAQFVGVTFPNLPPIPTGLPPGQQDLVLASSQFFPRKNADGAIIDTASDRTINGQNVKVYEYIVNNIDLDDGETITITPGQRVVFYVKGNINGAIEHNCAGQAGCKPGNLQIYADNGLGSAAPQICLKGNENLEGFIFAPDYSLGKTGTGTFTGAAWGKDWGKISGCTSSGAVAVTQGVGWTELIQDLKPPFPRLDKIANWCEEPIDTTGTSTCVP